MRRMIGVVFVKEDLKVFQAESAENVEIVAVDTESEIDLVAIDSCVWDYLE